MSKICAVAIGIAALCVVVIAMSSASVRAQGLFYQASPDEIAGPPGTLIRQEPMMPTLEGASAYRVLYRSTGLHGEPVAVSGVIIVPSGLAPSAGPPDRRLGTSDDRCRAALRAIACAFCLSANPGPA